MARCNIIKENNDLCCSVHGINRIIFYNTETNEIEKQTICQKHSDEILSEWLLSEQKLKIIKEKLENERKRHNTGFILEEKEYVKEFNEKFKRVNEEIKRIRWEVCRFPLCIRPKFEQEDQIYSAIVFSTNGRLRHIFNFHKVCFNLAKGRCNLKPLIIQRDLINYA